jgi:chemotaxis protein histidine kinase CheA
MLDDDDSELAEINDMLKKSDNNEPIKDDMMNLLDQMADDEANSVNEGHVEADDDDDGVPLPEYKTTVVSEGKSESDVTSDDKQKVDFESAEPEQDASEKETPKKAKKEKKEKVKKEKAKKEKESEEAVKGGTLAKIFDFLTRDLVPEPTEEELAAEKEEKEAKKKENLTKKEQEKLAKAEAKKAKAEEKAAAKKVKDEENAKKKKEKAEANKAKKEAKAEKKAQEAAANRGKKIPKKYILAAAIFGVTVFVGLMLSTTILSKQGYLRTARKAFYNQDYLSVYKATYGMDFKNDESDGLIQAKSEVIMKIKRRYDSYQNNIKMGREVEALDALIQGLATYDYINADAEEYGVASEVDAIKDEILNTAWTKQRQGV